MIAIATAIANSCMNLLSRIGNPRVFAVDAAKAALFIRGYRLNPAQVKEERRYRNTSEWESLAGCARLGWAALATALDVSLGQPDYSVDQTGWRPRTKPIRGPAKPGVLGVLQASTTCSSS